VDLRLAELLASLSLASDLGMGYPPEQTLDACLIASALARELNLDPATRADAYFVSLLSHVGCTAGAHEQAFLAGGDDVALRGIGSGVVFGEPREILTDFIFQMGKDGSRAARARTLGRLLTRGHSVSAEANRATCEVAAQMARRIGLADSVQAALGDMFERWDGKGLPRGLAGDAISLAMRVSQVASQAALFNRLGGAELACEVIARRAGSAFDPTVVDVFLRHAPDIFREVGAGDIWLAVLDAESRPHRVVTGSGLDRIARAFADVVDLKSPFMHQHSVEVGELAGRAADALGLGEGEVVTLRRAGMFHDLGRVGVPNGIWEKVGPLSVSEWEQVRLHPYHSERILARSPALAEVAALAGLHHERCDGSGYYRRLPVTAIPIAGRVIAASDAFQAMTQQRPHRPALSPEAAAEQLAAEASAGRLDYDAVDAVLIAAGQSAARTQAARPAGLTEREVEVLRLVARGLTNRQMARQLSISPKTVGHHIQHIYDKAGVSTRASATMFAMEHGLLPQ
jgi:HD-GYP domain-containing protein (c-di-GMP phosphodiesterase class II)